MIKLLLAALLLSTGLVYSSNAQIPSGSDVGPVRSSAAYSVVLLRKTEIEADLISFSEDYTEDNPKVVDSRYELAVINKEIDHMFGIKPTEVGKLTESTGKLILRKAELETELQRLQRAYKADHPQVKRLGRKVDIFTRALKQILG